MGSYHLNCFFRSTTQCKKINKKIAVDIEINIQEGVPAILLMIKYFLRKRPDNNDNSPANDKTPYKILTSLLYLIRQSEVIMPPNDSAWSPPLPGIQSAFCQEKMAYEMSLLSMKFKIMEIKKAMDNATIDFLKAK